MLDTWGGSSDRQVGVLIVGAGPVGLCHALWLRQFDVDVLVIDADARSHREEWMVLGPDARRVLTRVGVQSALDHARVGGRVPVAVTRQWPLGAWFAGEHGHAAPGVGQSRLGQRRSRSMLTFFQPAPILQV